MTTKTFFCLLASLLLLTNCGNLAMQQRLDAVEARMQDQPDSALALLRTIDTTKLYSRALQARYALLHATALDKNWIDTTDIGVVMPAVRYYESHKPVVNRARPWYYLGRIQYNGRNYDEAIISFTRAKTYAEELDDDRFKALIYQAISDTYSNTYIFEEALKYAQKAYSYALAYGDTSLANASSFNIAKLHNNLQDYRTADSLYFILAQTENLHSQTKAAVLANYAALLTWYKQDYEKALSLFDKALSFEYGFESYNLWGAYAYCLYLTGNTDKSETIFRSLENAGLQNNYVYLAWKGKIAMHEKEYQTALAFLGKSAQEQTNGVRELLRQSAVKAQRDYLTEQNDTLQKENRQQKTINILLIIAILTSVIAVFVIVLRYREHTRQKNQQLMEAAQDLVEQRQIVKDLSSEIDKTARKQELLRQEHFYLNQENFRELSDLCNTYYKTEGRSSQAYSVCGEVRGLLKNLGLGAERYTALEQRVNEQFDHIMEHFRAEYPGHREQYFQTVCYLFAGFKIRTVALLLHLSEQDVYQVRWRLKKEVESTPTPHQSDFLTLLNGPAK